MGWLYCYFKLRPKLYNHMFFSLGWKRQPIKFCFHPRHRLLVDYLRKYSASWNFNHNYDLLLITVSYKHRDELGPVSSMEGPILLSVKRNYELLQKHYIHIYSFSNSSKFHTCQILNICVSKHVFKICHQVF